MFHQNSKAIENAGATDQTGARAGHEGEVEYSVVDPKQKLGPCAKKVVKATLICLDGSWHVGMNDCWRPQQSCPRAPGEDYTKCGTICQQPGHAERMAIKAAGTKATGGTMYIEGIDRVCDDCQALMRSCEIRWVLGAPTSWIEIAWRKRHSAGPVLKWQPLPHAPHSIDEARELYNSGLYDMATRNEPDRAVLVIKQRVKADPFRRATFPPPRPPLGRG